MKEDEAFFLTKSYLTSFHDPHRLCPTSDVIRVIFVLVEEETLSLSPSSSSVSMLSPQLPDNGDTAPSKRLIFSSFSRTGRLAVGLLLSLTFGAKAWTVCVYLLFEGDVLEDELCWSPNKPTRKVMYRMARRRISFLLSFLSGGWVGISFRSSAKAPFTFCCLQRSRLLVKTRRATFCGCRTMKGVSKMSEWLLLLNLPEKIGIRLEARR